MFNITTDQSNKDVPAGLSLKQAKAYYLEMARSGKQKKLRLPLPVFETHHDRKVLRCDLVGGFKALAAERYIANLKEDVVVYCAPRQGYAPFGIAQLAKAYGKRAVFFGPACAVPTEHQACVLALGAELRWVKIAAMPVLNSYAKAWAEKQGAKFLPFGLSGVPEITANIVDLCDRIAERDSMPRQVWCATSTGTMIRGLQLGWPGVEARSIAVSRNVHDGEIGLASVTSATLPFLKASSVQPPFPTTAAYDAKAWEPCLTQGRKGSAFINVGSDASITQLAKSIDLSRIKSSRQWGDHQDLERPL